MPTKTATVHVYCVCFQLPGMERYGQTRQYPEALSERGARDKVLAQYPEAKILSVTRQA